MDADAIQYGRWDGASFLISIWTLGRHTVWTLTRRTVVAIKALIFSSIDVASTGGPAARPTDVVMRLAFWMGNQFARPMILSRDMGHPTKRTSDTCTYSSPLQGLTCRRLQGLQDPPETSYQCLHYLSCFACCYICFNALSVCVPAHFDCMFSLLR